FDRIGEGIDHLVDDVVGIDQTNDAGLLGRPEVLPAATEGVVTFGEQLVEVLYEGRVVAVRIVGTGVVMVAHGGGEENPDAMAGGGDGQAVDEGVVSLTIGTHQELPLRASARDHVGATRKNFSWNGHVVSSVALLASCSKSTSVGFFLAKPRA